MRFLNYVATGSILLTATNAELHGRPNLRQKSGPETRANANGFEPKSTVHYKENLANRNTPEDVDEEMFDVQATFKMKKEEMQENQLPKKQKPSSQQHSKDPKMEDIKGRMLYRERSSSTTIHREAMATCNGSQKIVQCSNGVAEEVCKQKLVDAGVAVVSDLEKTPFFAICADTQLEIDLVEALTDVEGLEDDPIRTLSHIPESEVVRNLQFNSQVTPYGIPLVNAPSFWEDYGTKGEGIKVCVIDTGIHATHEDFEGAELTGTDSQFLVTP